MISVCVDCTLIHVYTVITRGRDRLSVRYFGAFATPYGYDERAFKDPLSQLQVILSLYTITCAC